ncbi:nicotinate-nucleotide--dimethylbenzimidazole phosphoribosyltransferase [Alteribacillus sp. JSM 102045]|uniref:nicotinate-nucleotide--dimethylbenzimidazole phosphoribosyltransferase n=1 Tax=Alteribacillus sp. JSM 102045 TaxID=1562101 RepID=UPI0035BF7F6A
MTNTQWTPRISPLDKEAGKKATAYIDNLTKPPGSLGRLEKIAAELAAISGNPFPEVTPAGVLVFAADHGITEEGVSAFPQDITAQMARNFLNGGAAINVFANQITAEFQLVDIGMKKEANDKGIISRRIKAGTANFLREDAMTKEEAARSVQAGFEEAEHLILNKGIKCLILGEMGIGNTTASSAMIAAFTNKNPSSVTGPGTGLPPERILHKQQILHTALQKREIDTKDPIDVLAKVGGLEIAGITGAMLAAAANRVPILVDGFISATAAVTARSISPLAADYMFVGHYSTEPGHAIAVNLLNKKPLLDLEMRLGEGSGAALAFPILRSACAMVREMATFDDLETY